MPPGASLLVDSSVVLAYLAGSEEASNRAVDLFDRFIAEGRNSASLSAITIAQILVRPFRHGATAVATIEGFLQHFDRLRVISVDADVAREAARIRAVTNLPMPDALIVASALVAEADVLVTNDRSWGGLRGVVPDLEIVDLDGHG